MGAALALYWRAQPHSALRSQVRGAIIPGLLGVGEPLIYGVTLPRMKPFITACLGGAAGGLFIGLIAWWGLPMGLNSAFGPSGLVALPLMTSAQGILPAMAVYAGGILVAWVCGFIFTTLLAAVTSIWTDIMKRTMLYLSLLAVSCSVSAAKYPVLTESSPEKAGFNVERLNQMDRWISQQVDAGYPGVNLLIIKDNQIVYRKAWGAAKSTMAAY